MVLKVTVQKESPKQSYPQVTSEAASCRCSSKGDLRNFAIFTAKHLRWSLFLNKVSGLTNPEFI